MAAKRKTCPHGKADCDFTDWDHRMMDAHKETCDDWRAKREVSRAFADALARGEYRRPSQAKPSANDDFWSR